MRAEFRRYTLFGATVFLLFFRARFAFRIHIFDEACYVEWLHKMLGLSYPACYTPTHLPGVAPLWVPAALFAKVASFLSGQGFEDWLLPLLALSSFVLWCGSLFMLGHLFQHVFKKKAFAGYWPAVFLLCIPALPYATLHTLMSHAGELFITCLVFLFALKKRLAWALFFCLWLTFIRLNDAPVFLVVLAHYLENNQHHLAFLFRPRTWLMGAATLTPVSLLIYQVGISQGHGGFRIWDIARGLTAGSVFDAVFNLEQGLVFFLSFWVFIFIIGIYAIRRISWTSRASLFWMVILLCFYAAHRAVWTLDGPHYRFFIASFLGTLIVWGDLVRVLGQRFSRVCRWVLAGAAAWNVGLVWTGGDPGVWMKILTGRVFGEPSLSYDQSTFGFMTRKLILEPIGLSPIGFSAFSAFWDKAFFSSFRQFEVYALKGPELATLFTATFLALGLIVYLLLKRDSPKRKGAQ